MIITKPQLEKVSPPNKLLFLLVVAFIILSGAGYAQNCGQTLNVSPCHVSFSNGNYVNFTYVGIANYSNTSTTIALRPNVLGNYSAFNISGSKVFFNNNKTQASWTVNHNITVVLSSASGGCDYPTVQNYVGYTKLCSGSYNVYATSATTNGLTVNAANTFIECDNTILIGNSTGRGIGMAGSTIALNVTIKNCTLSNYSVGIRTSVGNNNTFIGNRILNSGSRAFSIENTNSSIFNNNYLECNITQGSSNGGIFFSGESDLNIINNTYIKGHYNGITFGDSNAHLYNQILNTNISYTENHGIYFWIGTNFTIVNNLRIFNTSVGNGIDLWGHYNNISNSNLNEFSHQGIDLLVDGQSTVGSFNRIFNNVINATKSDDKNCIAIRDANNNSVYDNTCYEGRLLIHGNETYQYGNQLYRNYLPDVVSSIIVAKSDSYFYNNILYGSLLSIIEIQSDHAYSTKPSFFNNTFLSGIAYYNVSTVDATNFSINENSNQHIINLYGNRLLYFNSPIRKVLTVVNNTYYAYNLTDGSYACVSIFNGTSNTPERDGCGSGYNKWNSTILSGNRTIVLNHVSATEAWFSLIATTIQTVNYSTSTDSFSYDCSGSGDIKITNLDTLKGDKGYYRIYHNNARYGYGTTNNYTTSSCSGWSFVRYDYTPLTGLTAFIVNYGLIILFIIVALSFILVPIMTGAEADVEYWIGVILMLIFASLIINFLYNLI